ncbi:MAG: hypothetical protein ACYTCU_07160, partial [Planctomycetota bacterium]
MSCRALILPLLVVLAAQVPAQQAGSDRFAGWDSMRSTDWVFDPDDRPVLGFSVRDGQAARSAIDDIESLLDDGDVEEAARELMAVIAGYGEQVVQVDGDNGRWMGAAEWALHLLRTRVPADVRATLAGSGTAGEIAEAAAWRDIEGLRRLAVRHDGTPEA